jgi:hypothetical protein
VLSSITAAVVAFEDRRGVPSGHYVIEGVALSTTDPTWAKFEVDAAAGYQAAFPSAFGIAHDIGRWTITGIGSAAMGCRGHDAVPVAVQSDLGLFCH